MVIKVYLLLLLKNINICHRFNMEFLVSIIIPVYNREGLIAETLRSVKEQTFANWECIIVDDSSTDNTKEVVGRFVVSDNRYRYHKRPNSLPKGANACRNYGFSMAEGKFIKFLDSDDLMIKGSLNIQYDYLKNKEKLDMVCGYVRFFKNQINNSWDVKPEIMNSKEPLLDYVTSRMFFHTTGPLWRYSFLKKQKKIFNTDIHKLQDTEFHYRMLLAGLNFDFINSPIAYYRRDSNDSITSNDSFQNLKSIFKYKEFVFFSFSHSNTSVLNKTRCLIANEISILSHKMISQESNLINRMSVLRLIRPKLFYVLRDINIRASVKFRINLGIVFTMLTGRGLKYFRINNPHS